MKIQETGVSSRQSSIWSSTHVNFTPRPHTSRISLANHKLTSPQLLREWWEKCKVVGSSSTLRCQCLQFGQRGCKVHVRKKSLMTDVLRRKRIQYASWQYASWNCEKREKVLFSDESTLCLFGKQANTYVSFPGEEFKPECLNLIVKQCSTL